jgi:hypothetical protein
MWRCYRWGCENIFHIGARILTASRPRRTPENTRVIAVAGILLKPAAGLSVGPHLFSREE